MSNTLDNIKVLSYRLVTGNHTELPKIHGYIILAYGRYYYWIEILWAIMFASILEFFVSPVLFTKFINFR